MRELDEDVWARYLVRKVREYSEGTKFAMDDLRFLNEYELLKKEGFLLCASLGMCLHRLLETAKAKLRSIKCHTTR